MEEFEIIKKNILQCRACQEIFVFEPTPIFWGNETSKIVQISQAPSKRVNEIEKPFMDQSGKTLKEQWYQITEEEFYNPDNFYITAMAHCYPGKDKNGADRQPPQYCYEKWIQQEIKQIKNKLYIVIGAKAASTLFPHQNYETLIFQNHELNGKPAIVLPHPSPLNRRWIKAHPEFLGKRIKEVREQIYKIIR